jgi:DNA replication protein DnaC
MVIHMLRYISKRLKKCNFESFIAEDAQSLKAKNAALDWLENYKDGSCEGLILMGAKGTGKTHLLAAICNELPQETYYWASTGELLDALQPGSAMQEWRKKAIACWTSCYGSCGVFRYGTSPGELSPTCTYCPGKGGDLMEQVMQAKLLILDDLGTRANNSNTDWVADRLFTLINYRYDNELPILASTNYSLKDLEYRLGHERITSRLVEMCRIIQVGGRDYRIKLRKEANQ